MHRRGYAAVTIGIDDLNVYGSTLAVDARAILAARGRPADFADRLCLVRRSLAPSWEDPVTLAVNAARPLVEGPDAFLLLIVATESGIDDAKPISSYVHRHLGLSEQTFHLEIKHACFGATAGLKLASVWAAAHPGQRALVVATDMARRAFDHPAEPVEGAGAVAMAVSEDPRVLALETHEGFAAREVYDVRRPTALMEVSNAELSLAAYLDLLEIAWEGYARPRGPSVRRPRPPGLPHPARRAGAPGVRGCSRSRTPTRGRRLRAARPAVARVLPGARQRVLRVAVRRARRARRRDRRRVRREGGSVLRGVGLWGVLLQRPD